MRHHVLRSLAVLGGGAMLLVGSRMEAQASTSIRDAVLGEPGQLTAEISTEELTRTLAARGAIVLDARPYAEYAISHIPGARNVAPKPGLAPSAYVSDVAEIERLLHADHTAPVVLYCNGPHCGKSKRLAAELVAAGYRNVRRYQLGIPVWRALGGTCEIELAGMRRVLGHDQTAVVIDARPATSFVTGSLPQARNIPRALVLPGKDTGEVRRAKDDGRLPMDDHNTRIMVIGSDAAEARYVAEALTREAFHNVAYFPGSFEEARKKLRK
jgi:rhodanese-related sulfurtransferase